ncbi:von Willebrand factor type A domain protein [Ancylostoma duodenale]|uniref:von Willebrand factor type A domain protein n=1 Tax=Ancylostoma duodenale TaxID=51022 RepID=A0A0C2CNZ3_9BILA|nr:von Willebrand factor type A domain protein [Ancylostoma duodenale]
MSIADLSWWKYLNWNVTKCTQYDDLNTVWWTTDCNTQKAAFGATCWLVTGILAGVLLLCLLVLGYAVYAYRRETKVLSYKLKEMEKTLRSQNEFFTAKLHSQMEEQIKAGERHAEELRKQNETIQRNSGERYMRGGEFMKQNSELNGGGSDGTGSKRDEELMLRLDKLEESLENTRKQNHRGQGAQHNGVDQHSSPAEHLWPTDPHSITEEDSSDGATDDSGYAAQGGKLPSNHPARHLPPVDLLLLVDSSSSIGISNFEAIKTNIINVLEDVDIGPGRSRVALVQYALQPSVVFGFDKYYSLKSVQKGVERMSYTGGATMLSKALSFAAGLLYKEQNMKDVKKRKHKLMPTPRHDRLQRLWAENYSAYIEREKSMPLSMRHSPKKSYRTEEQTSKSPKSV